MKYNNEKLFITLMIISVIVLIVAGGLFGLSVAHLIEALN